MASVQVKKQPQFQRNAYMMNKTPTEMRLDRFSNFGKQPEPGQLPPGKIEADNVGKFSHFPSKAAVIYAGHNDKHCPTAWLLAWDTTLEILPGATINKVFVVCGLKSVIDKMSDDEILKCLDAATSSEATFTDPITKTTVHANLTGNVLPIDVRLDATFGLAI